MSKYQRDLTEQELLFVKEAKEHHFTVDYDDMGAPFATGAILNGQCFSMTVAEHREADGESSAYYLKG